jgi:hypothetical protein
MHKENMSWTRRFLPTNFLCYPCFYTYINVKTEHIITVVSFEWSDITEFSNIHSYIMTHRAMSWHTWLYRDIHSYIVIYRTISWHTELYRDIHSYIVPYMTIVTYRAHRAISWRTEMQWHTGLYRDIHSYIVTDILCMSRYISVCHYIAMHITIYICMSLFSYVCHDTAFYVMMLLCVLI